MLYGGPFGQSEMRSMFRGSDVNHSKIVKYAKSLRLFSPLSVKKIKVKTEVVETKTLIMLSIGMLGKLKPKLRLWKLRPELWLMKWVRELWLLLLLSSRALLDNVIKVAALIASPIVDAALTWMGLATCIAWWIAGATGALL